MARLKQLIDTIHPNTNIKHTIQNTLKGDCEIWYQLVQERYETLDQFESLFIKQYWGEYN